MSKIFVELRSGLGNQLFQFAFAYSLAKSSGRELILVPAYFDTSIKFWVKTLLKREARRLRLPLLLGHAFRVKTVSSDTLKNAAMNVIKEGEANKSQIQQILGNSGDVYLKGYWQNPQLFSDVRDILASEIKPVFDLSRSCRDQQGNITDKSVAIHIRRGDFLTNKAFGACDMDYYNKGIEYILQHVPTPRFVVFTNDKAWVTQNLRKDLDLTIYDGGGDNADIEEMYLMSKFPSLIIANSTFSWWSAYLNRTNSQRVVAPSRWFLSSALQKNAPEMLDPSWKIFDNQLLLAQ
jgi:hypothetical protein